MLKTIYTIGREISVGRDVWRDIIETKTEKEIKGISYLVLNIIFDLDKKEIVISGDNYSQFDDSYENLKDLMYLKTLGRNMKSPYLCVDYKKIEGLYKTLFGKPNKEGELPEKGDLAQAIENDYPELIDSELFSLLPKLAEFRQVFEEKFKNSKAKFTTERVNEILGLSKRNKIVLLYPSITSNELGVTNKAVVDFFGYSEYLKKKFIEGNTKKVIGQKKLCYATGEYKENVQDVNFSGRYNINKLFVKETKNYASNFDPKYFHKNYQVSEDVQTFLDRGSEYILEHLVTSIAGVRHAIIPQFLKGHKVTREQLKSILPDTDLLFKIKKLSELEAYFQNANLDENYWLNFLAIDSGGNYFKVANLIKDVSKFHFSVLMKSLMDTTELLSPWLGKKYAFSLERMYYLIPVRKDKEKTNQALILFAAVLEGRQIDSEKIYRHFAELILCHWYERYKSFTNVRNSYSNFDFAVRDAVFGYMAFVNTLRRLNLLKNMPPMENKNAKQEIMKDISQFFDTMQYQPAQRALFYLGRVLNQVGYAQEKKGNKKSVLEKVNYNGMDKRSIYHLSNELFDKGKQYDILDGSKGILWNLDEFNRRFDFNSWNMNPQEALFFILSGYTYRMTVKTENDSESKLNSAGEGK